MVQRIVPILLPDGDPETVPAELAAMRWMSFDAYPSENAVVDAIIQALEA